MQWHLIVLTYTCSDVECETSAMCLPAICISSLLTYLLRLTYLFLKNGPFLIGWCFVSCLILEVFWSFVSYIFCRYVLPVCGLAFPSLDIIFCREDIFNFNYSFTFITFLFQVCLLNVLCRQVLKLLTQSLCPLTGYFFCLHLSWLYIYFFVFLPYNFVSYKLFDSFLPSFTKFSFSL